MRVLPSHGLAHHIGQACQGADIEARLQQVTGFVVGIARVHDHAAALAADDVRAAVRDTPLADAPIVAVSAVPIAALIRLSISQRRLSLPALITTDKAASEILNGWRKGQFHIHFPKRFTRMLLLMRLLPYRWYFALVRRGTGM